MPIPPESTKLSLRQLLVGQFVAEQSLFTMWFLRADKKGVDARRALLLTLVPMEQARVVYEAWLRFDSVPIATRSLDEAREMGERRAEAGAGLEKALGSAIDVLRRAAGGDPQ